MEFHFGEYFLDPAEGLSHGACSLHVTPKSLSVLHVLVAHPSNVIGKEQLIREVWNGMAVSDSALTSCIKELRRALDDDAKHPRFIETLNRRGFRLGITHGTVDGRVQLLTEALAGISEGLDLPDVVIARDLLDRLEADGGERQVSRVQ